MIGLDRAVVAGVSISPKEDIIPGSCAARTDGDDDDIQVNNPTGRVFIKDQGRVGGLPAEVIDYPLKARNGEYCSIRRSWGQE